MAGKNPDFYANKRILAPMVRGSRTPLRNLVLEYGADLAYTEELVDEKLLATHRTENTLLKTVDYEFAGEMVLRISRSEKSKCVLQVGTKSEKNLIAICDKFSDDIAALDINMGCPKSFSLSGGMGAALLSQPDLVKQMVSSLVSVAPIPVSCKIRLPETLEFAQMLENCGISALAVHGRQKDERPNHANRCDEVREVARALSIPVIASGESSSIKVFEDIDKSRERCGTSSIMVARTALHNPSIFRSEGLLTMEEEIHDFLDKACIFDESYVPTKYVVRRILGSEQATDDRGKTTVQAASMLEICRTWNKETFYRQCMESFNKPLNKRKIVEDKRGFYETDASFPPKRLKENCGSNTPKSVLVKYCKEHKFKLPSYDVVQRENDGRFVAVTCVEGKKYTSSVPQVNKKMAEQVAALSAVYCLNLRDELIGNWDL